MSTRQPWHKRPEESSKRYLAFCDYRDRGAGGGKRSTRELADYYKSEEYQQGNKTPPSTSHETLLKWSARNDWKDRVNAFDEEQMRLREVSRQKEEEEREKRRAELRAVWFDRETAMIEELVKSLEELRRYTHSFRLKQGEDANGVQIHVAKSSPNNVRTMIGAHADLVKLVAFVLGDPTEITSGAMKIEIDYIDYNPKTGKRMDGSE